MSKVDTCDNCFKPSKKLDGNCLCPECVKAGELFFQKCDCEICKSKF